MMNGAGLSARPPQQGQGGQKQCRRGKPDEVVRCVVFLAADEAGFITGSTLAANGGQYIV